MGRFYEKRAVISGDETHYFIRISGSGVSNEIEVSKDLYDALEDLQREYWRVERKESRHSWHIEDMRESDLPLVEKSTMPEQALMSQIFSRELADALRRLTELQRRRFVLYSVEKVSVKKLADQEGCSERAIKYSIASARENLKRILLSDLP